MYRVITVFHCDVAIKYIRMEKRRLESVQGVTIGSRSAFVVFFILSFLSLSLFLFISFFLSLSLFGMNEHGAEHRASLALTFFHPRAGYQRRRRRRAWIPWYFVDHDLQNAEIGRSFLLIYTYVHMYVVMYILYT